MAFRKVEGNGYVYFYPETDGIYPGWLDAVSIVPAGKNLPLRVAIHVNVVPGQVDPEKEPELSQLQNIAARKIKELRGYKELFEEVSKDIKRSDGVKQILRKKHTLHDDKKRELIEKVIRDNLMSGDAYDVVIFDAGPNSKIRSVLNMIGLPPDIKEAVSSELQKIWVKTPN